MDANNIIVDTFSHASSEHRKNTNSVFTSKKIDKSDKLVDAVHNLTINNVKYYESNTASAIDGKFDLTRNLGNTYSQ